MKLLLPIQLYFYLALSKLFSLFIQPSTKENSILYLAAFYPGDSGYHWRVKKWEEKEVLKYFRVQLRQLGLQQQLKESIALFGLSS